MDFDDLLMKTNELLNNYPEVLAKYQEKFKYILVDEYQDTNNSQYLIVKSLSDRYQNIVLLVMTRKVYIHLEEQILIIL